MCLLADALYIVRIYFSCKFELCYSCNLALSKGLIVGFRGDARFCGVDVEDEMYIDINEYITTVNAIQRSR